MEAEEDPATSRSQSFVSTKLGGDQGGQSEHQQMSSKPIPYLPEELVRDMLGYLSVSDLTSCRLVNKTWNRAAVVSLNRKAEIFIKSVGCITEYCETFANSILKVRSFHFGHELFEEIVDGINDGTGSLVLLGIGLQRLAEIAGEQVKELTVNLEIGVHQFLETTETRNEVYVVISQILFVHYTEVERLKLELAFVYDGDTPLPLLDDEEEDHEEITMVEHTLPKLKTLTINYFEDPDSALQRPELRVFKNLFKSLLNSANNLTTLFCEADYAHYVTSDLLQISPQLHTLHFRSDEELSNREMLFENEDMTALIQHRFPQLSALHVDKITWTDDNAEIFKRFLRNYADSLCSMVLHSTGDNLTFPPSDVTFKKLEKLELYEFNGKIVWENLPVLKELEFWDTDVTSDNLHPSTIPSDWPVTKFAYRISTRNKLNLETIYPSLTFPQFPLWFSKLSSLHLYFNQQQELMDVIPQIFHYCQQLKALTVFSSMSLELDECITGNSNSTLAILKGKCPVSYESDTSGPTSPENITKMIEVSKSSQSLAPNIGNLSELQELTLRGLFSDAAVLFGVVYCKKLRRMELRSERLTANTEMIAKCGLPDMKNLSIKWW